MTRRARVVVASTEAADAADVVVPVRLRRRRGRGQPSRALGRRRARASRARFSKEWCDRQGLKAEAGSVARAAIAARTPTSRFVITRRRRPTRSRTTDWPAPARCAPRRGLGRLFVADRGTRRSPGAWPRRSIEGALLAVVQLQRRGDADATFDVVPIGAPLPTVEAHDDVTEGVAARRRSSPTPSTGPSSSSTRRPATWRPRSSPTRSTVASSSDEHVTSRGLDGTEDQGGAARRPARRGPRARPSRPDSSTRPTTPSRA